MNKLAALMSKISNPKLYELNQFINFYHYYRRALSHHHDDDDDDVELNSGVYKLITNPVIWNTKSQQLWS